MYGKCECGEQLIPIWFIEEEIGENNIKTGRKRKACDYLECPSCLKKRCVDDTFDGKWY